MRDRERIVELLTRRRRETEPRRTDDSVLRIALMEKDWGNPRTIAKDRPGAAPKSPSHSGLRFYEPARLISTIRRGRCRTLARAATRSSRVKVVVSRAVSRPARSSRRGLCIG